MKFLAFFQREHSPTTKNNEPLLFLFLAELRLSRALAQRKRVRIAHSKRVKAGISAAQKQAWAKDPLRVQS